MGRLVVVDHMLLDLGEVVIRGVEGHGEELGDDSGRCVLLRRGAVPGITGGELAVSSRVHEESFSRDVEGQVRSGLVDVRAVEVDQGRGGHRVDCHIPDGMEEGSDIGGFSIGVGGELMVELARRAVVHSVVEGGAGGRAVSVRSYTILVLLGRELVVRVAILVQGDVLVIAVEDELHVSLEGGDGDESENRCLSGRIKERDDDVHRQLSVEHDGLDLVA